MSKSSLKKIEIWVFRVDVLDAEPMDATEASEASEVNFAADLSQVAQVNETDQDTEETESADLTRDSKIAASPRQVSV